MALVITRIEIDCTLYPHKDVPASEWGHTLRLRDQTWISEEVRLIFIKAPYDSILTIPMYRGLPYYYKTYDQPVSGGKPITFNPVSNDDGRFEPSTLTYGGILPDTTYVSLSVFGYRKCACPTCQCEREPELLENEIYSLDDFLHQRITSKYVKSFNVDVKVDAFIVTKMRI
jgi:hypothetical protein